eukprot:1935653-Pleurochrysis_carterae.AAC.1
MACDPASGTMKALNVLLAGEGMAMSPLSAVRGSLYCCVSRNRPRRKCSLTLHSNGTIHSGKIFTAAPKKAKPDGVDKSLYCVDYTSSKLKRS